MPRNAVREAVNALWQKIAEGAIPYSEDPETNKQVSDEDLQLHGIDRRAFDLNRASEMSPPFAFKPLELTVLREHPLSDSSFNAIGFVEYAIHTSHFHCSCRDCLRSCYSVGYQFRETDPPNTSVFSSLTLQRGSNEVSSKARVFSLHFLGLIVDMIVFQTLFFSVME